MLTAFRSGGENAGHFRDAEKMAFIAKESAGDMFGGMPVLLVPGVAGRRMIWERLIA